MILNYANFRDLFGSYLLIKDDKKAQAIDKELNQNNEDANSLFSYCYIDHEEGLSFIVLSTATMKTEIDYHERNDFSKDIILRKYEVKNSECEFLDKEPMNIYDEYLEDFLRNHTNPELEKVRGFELIDSSRDDEKPDDIFVFFEKRIFRPEILWVRTEKLESDYIVGKLLNSPSQNFGLKIFDEVKVVFNLDANDEVFCIADLE